MKRHVEPKSVDGASTLFPPLPHSIKPRARAFMNDATLQDFVGQAARRKNQGRIDVCSADFGDRYDRLRRLAGDVKRHVLDHLDAYLETFVANARAAGAVVHFAADADAANAHVVRIASERGLSACVKSKSMVTEETRLLPALESAGVEVIETDLGEFIIQLDGDAPSHIVMPMIHKDRRSVARAFERELGAPYTEDPAELTRLARVWLRTRYRRADLGVSGGNFLVADTGSLVLCTNEGNGRFCSSAPRVHVAQVGVEKLVPTMDHLALFLKLLARSATGQRITSYTHVVTGPRRADEPDGPDELHIVLVDAGRSAVLANLEYREALACLRCGACLNACPVYRKATGHAYGSVYPGPIGAVLTPLLRGKHNYPDLPGASSLCGACKEACPVDIDLPRMLIALRRDLLRDGPTSFGERAAFRAFAWAMHRPWLYRAGQRAMRAWLGRRADDEGFVREAGLVFRGWTDVRDLPAPNEGSFRSWWRDRGGARS